MFLWLHTLSFFVLFVFPFEIQNIICFRTMDYYKQISISNNPLDVILKICLGDNGVWIAVRGSSVIELWDPDRLIRILLFNIVNETYLSRRPVSDINLFNIKLYMI